MIANDSSYRDRLETNNNYFRKRITEAGFEVTGQSPIVPIMLYDAKLAGDIANDMLKKGDTFKLKKKKSTSSVSVSQSSQKTKPELEFNFRLLTLKNR